MAGTGASDEVMSEDSVTTPGPDEVEEEVDPTSAVKKEKRVAAEGVTYEERSSLEPTPEVSSRRGNTTSSRVRLEVQPPPLIFPKSLYEGWVAPLPPSKERDVLKDFLEEEDAKENAVFGDEAFTSVRLEDYSIYQDGTTRNDNEFAPLHHLCVKRSNDQSQFDGVLVQGEKRRYVSGVGFSYVSIGGYGELEGHSVRDLVWIQSHKGRPLGVWYHLGKPAPEYEAYHRQFLWLASFAKHVLNYLDCHQHPLDVDCEKMEHDSVYLHDFRGKFYAALEERLGHDQDYQAWLKEYNGTDFRRAVAANVEFLWNQAYNHDHARYIKHPIWKEAYPTPGFAAVKERATSDDMRTVVTPFVYDCFQSMPWAKFMRTVSPGRSQRKLPSEDLDTKKEPTNEIKPTLRRTSLPVDDSHIDTGKEDIGTIRVGDVVGVPKDIETVWKGKTDTWYAYVQAIEPELELLSVIWLYEPSDTTCSTTRYPFSNELFFSDNCNCQDASFPATEVVCKMPVAFFTGPDETPSETYFVRQKFRTVDSAFVTLRDEHFMCIHHPNSKHVKDPETEEKTYSAGDTVLVKPHHKGSELMLEPVEIISFEKEDEKTHVVVRKLPRRHRDFAGQDDAPPNELVYGKEVYTLAAKRIDRRCHVRFFTQQEKDAGTVPAPYSRNGTGDVFFITSQEVENGLEPLSQPFPPSLREAFDPKEAPSKAALNGLDLFCGGGSFGRGLEEGGVVHNKWAVDYYREAIHTYRANLRDPKDAELYYGSVNDFLNSAITGRYSKSIPEPGQVDFISAGSPCQGFSMANSQPNNDTSLRNCSLVASVAAFIDFYRPKYALLENVLGMAARGKVRMNENVFSQMLCTLVAMGYQVQQSVVDAWSHGSAQSRSRLFISIAAPGLSLPEIPPHSHSHPPHMLNRCIDRGSNGLEYGMRRFMQTPFQYVSGGEATRDLPNVGRCHSQTSIYHPDHRVSRNNTKFVHVSQVPIHPYGQSLSDARKRGRLMHLDLEKPRKGPPSRAWCRIDPRRLLPTITTVPYVDCAYMGAVVHWEQHRMLTVMEARRAQGLPDDEVLIGTVAHQWKIVGNGVARTVALAWGMAVRGAWLSSTEDTNPFQFAFTSIRKAREGSTDALQEDDMESLEEASPPPTSGALEVVISKSASKPSSSDSGGALSQAPSPTISKRKERVITEIDEESLDPTTHKRQRIVERRERTTTTLVGEPSEVEAMVSPDHHRHLEAQPRIGWSEKTSKKNHGETKEESLFVSEDEESDERDKL
ncbi:MAG: Vacuolar protein sorting-associated protein 17 [Chaenotheca gracillima]|nr:MAG: Vacuolar protein sorting-associated protein 17 [Chaenotheca gracillima]